MSETGTTSRFTFDDDPDLPGWKRWRFIDTSRFNSYFDPLSVKVEDGVARVRTVPRHDHSNMRENVHGGALLGFIDTALFAAVRGLGLVREMSAVTVDLSAQFIGGSTIGEALEARIELLRETKNLIFLRGLVVQDGMPTVASFTATLRKSSLPPNLA